MRLSHIHENEEVHDGYHCTSIENAEDIKNNGFKSFPQDLHDYLATTDDFDKIMQELVGMFNNNSVAKPLLDQFWSKTEALNNEEWIISLYEAGDYETEDRLGDELNNIQDSLSAIWLNEFKDGTFIWLSGRQEEKYGNVCFSVTLPDTAIEIYSASEPDKGAVHVRPRYTLYFVPARIPSQNFKPA